MPDADRAFANLPQCPACGTKTEMLGHVCPNPPRRYRKKPVVIRAQRVHYPLDIVTLEGIMHANAGDYVIEGVKGEMYPCKPDVFEATYEPA